MRRIHRLTRGANDPQRVSAAIDQHVNFISQSSTGTAKGLINGQGGWRASMGARNRTVAYPLFKLVVVIKKANIFPNPQSGRTP